MKRQEELNEAWCKYRGKCSTEIMQALAFALRWADAHPNISMASDLAYEAGHNDAIEAACKWIENNLDKYLVIEEGNYEGWTPEKACYIHGNVYRDFEESMKGGEQ